MSTAKGTKEVKLTAGKRKLLRQALRVFDGKRKLLQVLAHIKG